MEQEWFDDLAQAYELEGYAVSYGGSGDVDQEKPVSYTSPYGNYWRIRANDKAYECVCEIVEDLVPDLKPGNVESMEDLLAKYEKTGDVTKHVYYYEGEDGYIDLGHLGLDNKPISGFFGASWNWASSGFANPFGKLTPEDFTAEGKDSEGLYSFRYDLPEKELVEPAFNDVDRTFGYALGNMAVGTDADSPITSIVLKTDGTKIVCVQLWQDYSTEEEYWGTISKRYSFALYDFKVVHSGDAVEVYDFQPIELPEADPDLEQAFETLRSSTFTETNVTYAWTSPYDSESYEYLPAGYWEPQSYSITTKGEGSFVNTVYDYGTYGMMTASATFPYRWNEEEKTIQPFREIQGKYYPVAKGFDYESTGYILPVPSVSMDAAFFEKVADGVYCYDGNAWMQKYPVSNYTDYLLAYDSLGIEEMTVTLEKDGTIAVSVESGGYYRMDATFSNIGTTTEPLDDTMIEESTDALSWKDMVDPDYYETLALAGWTDELANIIPTLGGDYVCDIAYYDGEAVGFMYMFQYPGELNDQTLADIAEQYKERLKATGKWSDPISATGTIGHTYISEYSEPISLTDTEGASKTYDLSITFSAMNMEGSYIFAIFPELTEIVA